MTSSDHSQRVARRLLTWSALSVSSGLVLGRSKNPVRRGVGEQFTAWGTIDGAIALAGWALARRRQRGPGEPESLQETQQLQRLLLVNAGLDVLYVAGGAAILLGRGRTDATWRGRGLGVLIQGGFLLGFDLWHGLTIPAPESRE
jgi:hypothetical protein